MAASESTADKRGRLTRTASVISEAVEDDEGIHAESSGSFDDRAAVSGGGGGLGKSSSAPDLSELVEESRGAPTTSDGDDDEGEEGGNTVTRVFLYEVVTGIRLSCLAEEDGTMVGPAAEKKPRRHKHVSKRLKKNRATSLRHSRQDDDRLDEEFSQRNPEAFLTAEVNPLPRDEPTLETETIAEKHGMQAKEFRRNSRWLLKTQPTESGERLDVEIKTYAASIFRRIRVAAGVSTDEFCESWNYTFKDLPKMQTGAGRSGSLFLASADGRYFFKTLPYVEVQTLLDILPQYFDYITDHPESRLMRVFNILRFSDPRRIHGYLYLIVFPNAFYSPERLLIHEKYDLKGRVPKPGKEGRHNLDNVDPVRYVFKDNDITSRRYVLPPGSRDQLVRALTSDVRFLQANGCMDYSLLVGVHRMSADDQQLLFSALSKQAVGGKKHRKRPGHSAASSTAAASSSSSSTAAASSTAAPPAEITILAPPSDSNRHRRTRSSDHRSGGDKKPSADDRSKRSKRGHRRSVSHGHRSALPLDDLSDSNSEICRRFGLLSADGKETYFISIIDFLARYTMAKKGAHFFKTFLWKPDTLSTVPPDFYGERWLRAMIQVFPPNGEELTVATVTPASEPVDEDDA